MASVDADNRATGTNGGISASPLDDEPARVMKRAFLLLDGHRGSVQERRRRRQSPDRLYEDLCLEIAVASLERHCLDSVSDPEWTGSWAKRSLMATALLDLERQELAREKTGRWLSPRARKKAEASARERFEAIIVEVASQLGVREIPGWQASWATPTPSTHADTVGREIAPRLAGALLLKDAVVGTVPAAARRALEAAAHLRPDLAGSRAATARAVAVFVALAMTVLLTGLPSGDSGKDHGLGVGSGVGIADAASPEAAKVGGSATAMAQGSSGVLGDEIGAGLSRGLRTDVGSGRGPHTIPSFDHAFDCPLGDLPAISVPEAPGSPDTGSLPASDPAPVTHPGTSPESAPALIASPDPKPSAGGTIKRAVRSLDRAVHHRGVQNALSNATRTALAGVTGTLEGGASAAATTSAPKPSSRPAITAAKSLVHVAQNATHTALAAVTRAVERSVPAAVATPAPTPGPRAAITGAVEGLDRTAQDAGAAVSNAAHGAPAVVTRALEGAAPAATTTPAPTPTPRDAIAGAVKSVDRTAGAAVSNAAHTALAAGPQTPEAPVHVPTPAPAPVAQASTPPAPAPAPAVQPSPPPAPSQVPQASTAPAPVAQATTQVSQAEVPDAGTLLAPKNVAADGRGVRGL